RKNTRRDTGFRREMDTDSQYIDYSYMYNPICLRCKMHRFCPKDRVLLVTASLEERASEGGAAAVVAADLVYSPKEGVPSRVVHPDRARILILRSATRMDVGGSDFSNKRGSCFPTDIVHLDESPNENPRDECS
ncbi:hypothetical protein ALC56_10889, partial [Trachymyrmex septentrionalis]